jgi:hypothetical protein
MADKKITGLTELTAAASDDYLEIVDTSTNTSKKISRETLAGWYFLTTRLTSTAWDGDSFSTTAKTLIDLSAVFGVPAGVKAVLAGVSIRDSGSAASTGGCYLILSPVNTTLVGVYTYCAGLTNDAFTHHNIIVPCDANGDIYYQINASGSGTMDAYIEIWGYWL